MFPQPWVCISQLGISDSLLFGIVVQIINLRGNFYFFIRNRGIDVPFLTENRNVADY